MRESAIKNFKPVSIIFFTAVVFGGLYVQAINPVWRGHLEIDVWLWYRRVEFLRDNLSFAGLENRELLPGAYALILAPVLFFGLKAVTYIEYLQGVISVNFLILALHVLVYRKLARNLGVSVFLLMLAAFGPIILFRYDSLATLALVTSIWMFRLKKLRWSGFFIGSATGIKVFPLIVLPYFLLVLYRRERWRKDTGRFLAGLLMAVGLFVLGFMMLGGGVNQFFEAMKFHSLKGVSIESVAGVILTGISLIKTRMPLPLIGGYGIWAVKSELIESIDKSVVNLFWTIPTSITYGIVFIKKKFTKKLQVGIILWLVLVFLIFSKNLNPQYLFWYMALYPLIKIVKKRGRFDYWLMLALILISAVLTQLVYPVFYTDFIQKFYGKGLSTGVYYVQLTRNIILVAILLLGLKAIFVDQSVE